MQHVVFQVHLRPVFSQPFFGCVQHLTITGVIYIPTLPKPKVYNLRISPDQEIALFDFSMIFQYLDNCIQAAVTYDMIFAKKIISRLQKSDTPPRFKTYIKEVVNVLPIERLRYERQGSLEKKIQNIQYQKQIHIFSKL